MIVTCTGCQARYRLDASKVPPRQIRVRCPDCTTVFDLDGTRRDEPLVQAPPLVEPTSLATPTPAPGPAQPTPPASGSDDLVIERASATVAAAPDATPRREPVPMATGGSAEVPPAGRRRRRDKSEMLARALVSDILVYNREARDQALADGNLLEALGPEIKKSWELYKEKVGAEAASGTSHFKDALNEILAEGRGIF